MEAITLQVEERAESGGRTGDLLRAAGKIPAVVYGKSFENKLATLSDGDFRRHVLGQGSAQLFRFKSGSKVFDGQLALVKEVQMEPLKGKPVHIDFLAIAEDQPIVVAVPLEIQGESPSIKAGDALLNQSAFEVTIEAVPSKIPNILIIDISSLLLGSSIHASEIVLPEGVRLKSDPVMTIVSVVHRKEEVLETKPVVAAAEGEAAAAGAEGAAADAKAAPAGDKDKKADKK